MYETATQNEEEIRHRADRATAAGTHAFGRLLAFAERSATGQAIVVARFIASTLQVQKFDLYDLRQLDGAISDDVISCIEALSWGRQALQDLVPSGHERCVQVCRNFNIS